MLWLFALGEISKHLVSSEENIFSLVLHLGLIGLNEWPLLIENHVKRVTSSFSSLVNKQFSIHAVV